MNYEIFISKKPQNGREVKEIEGIPVVTPVQVHGEEISFVASVPAIPPISDGLITDSKKIWIGVLTADCLPIFLVGEGAVGIVHAGWRGTLKGVAFNAASYMSKFTRIRKAILGVSICGKCYEVGADVRNAFSNEYSSCFTKIGSEKFLFDLKCANRIQLKAAGVEVIESLDFCTVCNNDIFFSYRKERTKKRTLSAIRLL